MRNCAFAFLLAVITLSAASAQVCPPVIFGRAADVSNVTQTPVQTGAGLQRNSDGSFTRRAYSATNSSNVTQRASSADGQNQFYNCTGLPARPARQPLPGGWRIGGDAMTGRGANTVSGGDFLNSGTLMGLCTSFCGGNTNGLKLLTGQLDSNFNLITHPEYTVSGTAVGVLAADMNNDGRRDAVVISTSTQGIVSVYLLAANGTFAAPITANVPQGPRMVAAFDLNGDNKLDLVIAGASGFSVLLGNGDGTLQSAVNTSLTSEQASLTIADVNGDGKGDLVLGRSGAVAVALGNGNGTFQALRTITVQGALNYIAVADLNKDAKPDIVAADDEGSTIAILPGDGAGNFSIGPRYVTDEHNDSFFLMDFDLDGNTDIVIARGHPDALVPNLDNGQMSVLFGKGDGTFHGAAAYPGGRGSAGSVLADFNGDGKPDWARVALSSSTIPVYLGQGGADFRTTSVTVPGAINLGALGAGDFNGDGKVDLVAAESGTTTMYLLLGKGDGTFQNPTTFTGASDSARMATADLNQDGKVDLVYSSADDKVYVQLGNGSGGFAAAVGYASGAYPGGVQIVDVNADGKSDLVVTNRGLNGVTPATVAVFIGRGDGTFNGAVSYPAGVLATATAVGDLNGDGKPDLVVSISTTVGITYRLQVYLNQGNGSFTAQPLINTSFGPQEIAIADYTRDGKVDLLVAHCCGRSELTLLAGNGDGTFQAEAVLMKGLGQKQIAAVDLNNDGKMDVIASHGNFEISMMAMLNLTSASATITSPASGSRLAGSTLTLNWSAVPNATKYRVDVGSAAGGVDLFSQETTATSLTVNNLPQDGRTLYVQVSAYVSGSYGAPAAITYLANYVAVPLRFVPLPPCRVMETRSAYNFEGRTGAFGPPSLNAAETRALNLPVSNVCSIPATAKAYVVNVTVIPNGALSYVTVWPAGEARPNVWTIRSPDGQVVANSAIVKAGASGGISVYASDRTDLLIDISGYYTDSTAVSGLAYYPLAPCRVIDTRALYRSPAGPFGPPTMGARETRRFRFPATPYCTVPQAAAYSVTITAVPPGPLPYLTAWPAGGAQPNVSSINSFVGRVLANSVIIPASDDGSIDVFAYDTTDFIVDINGYYAPDDGQRGLFYYPVPQCRASDSTVSGGAYPNDTARTISIPAASGCSGIPANAQAYAINVTALPNGNPMPFITAYPTGQARPNASILNAFQGQVVSNSAIIPAGTNGAIDVYAFTRTDVVVEISGYFGR